MLRIRRFAIPFTAAIAAAGVMLAIPASAGVSVPSRHYGPHPAYIVTFRGVRDLASGRDVVLDYRQWAQYKQAHVAWPGRIYRLPWYGARRHRWQRVSIRHLQRGRWGAYNHRGQHLIRTFRP